jgi:hypothetical protein
VGNNCLSMSLCSSCTDKRPTETRKDKFTFMDLSHIETSGDLDFRPLPANTGPDCLWTSETVRVWCLRELFKPLPGVENGTANIQVVLCCRFDITENNILPSTKIPTVGYCF